MRKIEFSLEDDQTIIQSRSEGLTWQQIADKLSWSRNKVIERGRRIISKEKEIEYQNKALEIKNSLKREKRANVSDNRASLPAGHPTTWSLISNGLENPFKKGYALSFIGRNKS